MPIITLTSDLGLKDHYVAALKGSILSEKPGSILIDISHLVQPFNILEASYIIKNSFSTFPGGSVHVVCVNLSESKDTRFLVARHNDHFFIGPDNGIFPLISEGNNKADYFEIESEKKFNNVNDAFLEALCKVIKVINSDAALSTVGRQVHEPRQRTSLQPVIYPDVIRGSIFYIDRFNNAIANINKDLFVENIKDRKYEIIFNRNAIDHLCMDYADVPEGEKLCLFNSAGFLEIAINKGKASSLLGLGIGSNVLIEFS